MPINWLWRWKKPEPIKSWGPLKTIVPDRVLPDHLDFLLDENSFADMMERKEELEAWGQGDEVYTEWLRLHHPKTGELRE
jgi:hypothetical protein